MITSKDKIFISFDRLISDKKFHIVFNLPANSTNTSFHLAELQVSDIL